MSRHGKFAPGRTRINVVTDIELKDELKKLAAEDRRQLSDYIRIKLEDIVAQARDLQGRKARGSVH